MSLADQERYENEDRPEVQRQILAEIARKLPVYTRTGSGGQPSTGLCFSTADQARWSGTRWRRGWSRQPAGPSWCRCVQHGALPWIFVTPCLPAFMFGKTKRALSTSVRLQWSTRCCLWEAIRYPLYLQFKSILMSSAFSNSNVTTKSLVVLT